jgi:hypothetical protein
MHIIYSNVEAIVVVIVWYVILKKNEKKLARSFNSTFRYIDDVLTLNNSVSFTNKTDRPDITELLLKVALNAIKQTNKQTYSKVK